MEYGGWVLTLGRGKVQRGLFLSVRNGGWVGLGWRANSKGKAHCKKLKQERWFQLGDSMQRKSGATPQHRIRYRQSRPGALGILQYANRVIEIIPVRQVRQRNNLWTYPMDGYQKNPPLVIQAKSTLLNQ